MAAPAQRPASRYRRRILVIGALATFSLYVIGAPIFNNRIEDDLEHRVPDELAAAGFTGVTARFSGQDGILDCAQPLDDPEVAIEAAYDVWGVRAIELDRSCRVNRAPTVAATTTTVPPETATVSLDPGDDAPDTTVTTSSTTVPPDFATVGEIVATDPQFGLLSVLLDESGLDAELADPGADPVTLFAPTDDAFDDVPADVIAELRADPDLLHRVLRHHVVAERLAVADLVDGPLATLDGGDIEVAVTAETVTVDGATIDDPDIAAANGLVHGIDRLLVPADIATEPTVTLAASSVTLADGSITLDGVVASEVERAALVNAAGTLAVVDRLAVDPEIGLDAVTAATLVELVTGMRAHLVSGVSGFDGTSLYVTGSYVDDAEREAMATIAERLGATAELQLRPDATETDAVDLEAQLNAFVAENPILFEPSSAVLVPSAFEVIDRIVLEAQQFAGLSITVEGHTDSDGDATENLALSRLRAVAVRDALVERGIEAGSITAEGFGSERPVLVDGVEDKDASRRVEFRVLAT
jgi:OOP family OmpA-OmpF porin